MKKIFLISLIILLIDVLTKQIVIRTMFPHQSITIIHNFFQITYAKNTGVAFSILEGKQLLIIIMTLIVLGIFIKYIKELATTKYDIIAYALVIGGALGNLLDRIIYGYVIDFLDFQIFNYNFPIFNVADIGIVVGIFLLLLKNFKESRNNNETNSRRKNKNR